MPSRDARPRPGPADSWRQLSDAQQVVSDAGEQARVLMQAAQTHHDQIVAEAERTASQRHRGG